MTVDLEKDGEIEREGYQDTFAFLPTVSAMNTKRSVRGSPCDCQAQGTHVQHIFLHVEAYLAHLAGPRPHKNEVGVSIGVQLPLWRWVQSSSTCQDSDGFLLPAQKEHHPN